MYKTLNIHVQVVDINQSMNIRVRVLDVMHVQPEMPERTANQRQYHVKLSPIEACSFSWFRRSNDSSFYDDDRENQLPSPELVRSLRCTSRWPEAAVLAL